MKYVLIVYLFYLLYHTSYCDYQQLFEIVEREHPKRPNLLSDFRHLQYLNPVKVVTKKPSRRFGAFGNLYTLFPPVESRRIGVPDSPYFPLEKNMEAKSRVKKVMADSAGRYKRSAIDQNSTKKVVPTLTKAKVTSTTKVNKVTDKPNTKVAKAGKETKRNIRAVKPNNTKTSKRLINKSKPIRVRKIKRVKSKNVRQNRGSRGPIKKAKTTPVGHGNPVRNAQTKKSVKDSNMMSQSARRIIAGRDTAISQFPYVISIQKDGQHWCAGALLNQVMFISTANCFWKSIHMTRMTIRAGSSYVDRGGRVAKIQEVCKHPSFSIRGPPDHDIALGLLDRVMRFTNELHSVDLPNHNMHPPFDDLFVTSWGAVRADGIYEKGKGQILQVYRSSIMDTERCRSITIRFGVNVSTNFFCLDQVGQTAPCTSDTGAPAVNDGVLWGLASWGIRKRCGTTRYPAIFSFVGSMENLFFITNATQYLMTDKRTNPYLDRLPVEEDDSATPRNLARGHNQTRNDTDFTGDDFGETTVSLI